MPDPYNYSINLQSPLQAFSEGFQATNAVRQQQAQQAQAQAQREALQSISTDRSLENMARILLVHPELKDQITSSQSVLNDAQKKEDILFKTQLLTAYNGGKPEVGLQLLEQRRAALANTPGKEQEAKALADITEAVRDNPDLAKNILSMQLSALDPDGYKTVFGAGGGIADLDKNYALNVQLYGKPQADAWRQAEEAKKGIIVASGPLGTSYIPALQVSPMVAAASAAAPPQAVSDAPSNVMTADQFKAGAQALGAGAADWAKRNGIAVRVRSPQEARSLPSGTPIILPDGSPGVVP